MRQPVIGLHGQTKLRNRRRGGPRGLPYDQFSAGRGYVPRPLACHPFPRDPVRKTLSGPGQADATSSVIGGAGFDLCPT